MGIGFKEILVIAIVFILLFGRGKISDLMGDVAKGIKSFKKGMADEDLTPAPKIDSAQPTVLEAEKQVDKQA